jgi:ubiquinone biosynthesis monooxygenase Coq7
LRRFDRCPSAGTGNCPTRPAKGAKFYSTSWRNANNPGLFEQSACCREFAKNALLISGLFFRFRRILNPRPDFNPAVSFVVIIPPVEDRHYSTIDRIIGGFDNALRTISSGPATAARPYPADGVHEAELSGQEKKHAAGLMRVNHAGEVAAQGLYQGHAAVARDPTIEAQIKHAADEELDHLAWCEQRLNELGSAPSALRPIWYGGAFIMGAASGILGDKWSLGFIEETEHQVAEHLTGHLAELPADDQRSRTIVGQMREEEEAHGANAQAAGAAELPPPIRDLMRLVAKVMTATAYRV